MNIFYLDKDPKEISEMQCDKHCVKMILESYPMKNICEAFAVGLTRSAKV